MNRSRQVGKKQGKAKEGREKTKSTPKPKRYVKGDLDSRYRDMEVAASEVWPEKIQKKKWEFNQPFSDAKSTETNRVFQEGKHGKTKAQSQKNKMHVHTTVSRLT